MGFVAVAASGWLVAHAAGLLGPLADATFVFLGVAALVAGVVGVRRHRPALRWPWLVISAALLLFLVGGATRVALGTLGDLSSDRALLPDLFTLPGYLLVGLGLSGLARARAGREPGEVDALLDAVVAALGALAVAWVFLVNPVLSSAETPVSVRLLLVSYTPMSIFLLVVMARLAFGLTGLRTFADRALLGAVGAMLVGDVVYMLVDARIAEIPATVVDIPYALAYVGFIAAVLHPSMRLLCEPGRRDSFAPSRPRLAIVALALALPALVMAMWHDAGAGDRVALVTIVLSLSATGIWRFFRALRAHARAEARMAHQALHDGLTGLPNRRGAEMEVERRLQMVLPGGDTVAVAFLDVDQFKLINDTFGHSIGDEFLMAVTERLEDNVRPGDLVTRVGGDEFLLVLGGIGDEAEALRLAESLRCCFLIPFFVDDFEVYATASVGVALSSGTDPVVDAETVIREADTAMYEAKAAGRDAVAVFDASMRHRMSDRLRLEHELRQAIDAGQLHLHYQPTVRLRDGQIQGVEALLRWSHPELGEVSPGRFIPVAEGSGLIIEIGSWVLDEACRQVAAWRAEVPVARDLNVAVNLSARQLRDPAIVDRVARSLADSGLPAEALTLELTESLLMEDPEAMVETLTSLRGLGVRLSVDDFGTGYSSLAYLKRFPVHEVKIDRAFVEGLRAEDSAEESLVAAIVAMTRTLRLDTIAEGVETAEQRERLVRLDCPQGQGFYFARPVPPERLPGLLEDDTLVALGVPGL